MPDVSGDRFEPGLRILADDEGARVLESGDASPEMTEQLRELLVKARRQQREIDGAKSVYPYKDSDLTVLGPEIFVTADGGLICLKGVNYIPQAEADENAAALKRVRRVLAERQQAVRDFERENAPSSWSDGVAVTCIRLEEALARPGPAAVALPEETR